jgi:hypothetical protein
MAQEQENPFSEADQKWINQIYLSLFASFHAHNVPAQIAMSASMLVTSDLAVQSDETDETIVEIFKKCLEQSRAALKAQAN